MRTKKTYVLDSDDIKTAIAYWLEQHHNEADADADEVKLAGSTKCGDGSTATVAVDSDY